MPTYIYACPEKHEVTLVHPIEECNIPHHCVECNQEMHRTPQAFRHYYPPGKMLLDILDDNFHNMKARTDKWRRKKQLGKIL